MDRSPGNLVPNYIDNEWNYNGPGVKSIDPGLQLWVRSELLNPSQNVDAGQKPLVPSSEIVSQRDDILYGSFRIAMKTTEINGTCTAFFLYRNDTQEIDMEILSAQQHSDTNDWPIHLVVQNTSVGTKGDQDGSSQMVYQMAFPPGGFDYNEYRFDWLPGRIDYYINSWFAWSETENVPSTPGRIHISHCKSRLASCTIPEIFNNVGQTQGRTVTLTGPKGLRESMPSARSAMSRHISIPPTVLAKNSTTLTVVAALQKF
jgi:hypothetical protein